MATRRDILKTGALGLAGGLAPVSAWGMGADAEVGVGLLKHGRGWDQRPGAVEQLMWEVSKRTSIDVRDKPIITRPDSPDLFRSPLVVWIGTGAAEPLSDPATRRLRRFLRAGGLLYIDDASAPGSNAFDTSVRETLSRVMDDAPLQRISNDHTIFRSFYLLERSVGRVRRQDHLEGIEFDDRSAVIYNRNDLFGSFGRDPLGNWKMPMQSGGARRRELAFRMGINLLMYGTCLNYKRDQVHVTAILRRRRWRVDDEGPTR